MCDANNLSRQLTLADAATSEIEQTCKYEQTHLLPAPLDQFQNLIDIEAGKLTQPISGGCTESKCEPGERCDECINAMWQQGRAESWIVCSSAVYDQQPCLTAKEVEPAETWQLILAAQQADAVTAYFMQQLAGEEPESAVNLDDCDDEFKVMANQFKHLSIAEEVNSEVPPGLLFYKKSRIVAPKSIRHKLMSDSHDTCHVGVTKTYNTVRSLFWWPGLFSDR